VNDLCFALRQLLKSPGFTFLAVLKPTLDLAFVGDHGVAASQNQLDGGAAGRMKTRHEFSPGKRGRQAC
jgi:hypothetical protein